MAKVTSSRNRSTRSASKPPTTGQNPGRANRQSISQAKVTTSQQRSNRMKASTANVTSASNGKPSGAGSAKVTTGQGKAPGTLSSSAQAKAEARGKQAVRDAQIKRNARSAMKSMEGTLKAARTARNVASAVAGASRGGAAAAGLQAYNTGDSTLKAALKRGDYKPKQGPTQKTTTASFNKKSFGEAFKAARSSGAKEFSWRGTRYNTKKKGE